MIRRSFFKCTGVFIIGKFTGIPGWSKKSSDLPLLDPLENKLVNYFMSKMWLEWQQHKTGIEMDREYFVPFQICNRQTKGQNMTVAYKNKNDQLLSFARVGSKKTFSTSGKIKDLEDLTS